MPLRIPARLALTGLCVAALTACSGGGGAPPVAKPAVPATPPSPSAGSSNTVVTLKLHSVSHAASSARRPQYVSPSTTGVIFSVHDSDANTTNVYGYDVSPQPDPNTSCGPTQSDGTRSCLLGINAVPGNHIVVTATIYDAVPSPLGPNPNAAGHALATGASASTLIVAGQPNNVSITLSGIIAGLATHYVGGSSAPSFGKIAVVTLHPTDYDGNQIDIFDSSTVFNNSVTVQIGDAGDTSSCSSKCASWDFGQTVFTQTISNPKTDGSTGAEGAYQAYYQQTNVPGGTNNAGDESTKSPYYARIVPNPVPNPASSPLGETDIVPLFASPATLALTSSGGAKTLYAAQFHAPDGSTGYSIDNACNGLVSAGAAQTATWGAQFLITPLTNGSCTAHLSDGAGDIVAAPITISGFTTRAITAAQTRTGGSQGAAVRSASPNLGSKPTVGNTLVIIAAEGSTALAAPAGYTQLDNFPLSGSLQGYAVFVKDVTDATADQNAVLAYSGSATGPISWFMGEYQNTAANLFSGVSFKGSTAFGTAGATGSSTTNTITTDSANTMVFSAASSGLSGQGATGASDPYTVTSGWSGDFFAAGASSTSAPCVPAGSLDVQTMALAAARSISNTFSVSALGNVNGAAPCTTGSTLNPNTNDIIFYARPKA